VVKWFLFQTRLGELLLALFEQLTGLAIVDNDYPYGLWADVMAPAEED